METLPESENGITIEARPQTSSFPFRANSGANRQCKRNSIRINLRNYSSFQNYV